MEIKKELLDIVTEYLGVSPDEIDTSLGFKYSGMINSFVLLSMVSEIENHFDISIPNCKLREFNCLDDIIAFIETEI